MPIYSIFHTYCLESHDFIVQKQNVFKADFIIEKLAIQGKRQTTDYGNPL